MIPTNWLTMVKLGRVRGTVPLELRTFQSNVGQGLIPIPPVKPVIADSLMLLGAIQVIQEKLERAGKRNPGNQNQLLIRMRYSTSYSHKHGAECQKEKLLPGHFEDLVEGSANWLVLRSMEGLVKSNSGERRGPNSDGGVDKESTGQASKTVTDEGETDSVQKLVTKLASEAHVEEEGHSLGRNDGVGVTGREGDVGHNRDQHVLLPREWSWVERHGLAKEAELAGREDSCHEFANGVGQQLGDVGSNGNRGQTVSEEGVDK